MKNPSLFLVLSLNALTSALAGVLLLLLPGWVAELLGQVPAWICQWVGAGLLLFGLGVGYIAWQLPHNWSATRWILVLDLAWLVATPIVMLVFASHLSLLGNMLLVLVAGIVFWYARWEAYWLRRTLGHIFDSR